ncbi:AzlC family ABC transporter permease [Arenibaculum sp.]|jgi:4-azaleucine resistance transporter AzlC|uniref:AzlC family ABC transporter permease n=1 Tax=Arenibaculum sp. TaxID=2865862 RepID=UPI002E0FCC42|nr:AzlC family ABC transporter permease [Arenibaculum sp.]
MSTRSIPGHASPWRRAFAASLPILAGYVPIGMAFGILWVQQGLEPMGAVLFGLLVYAGASQFMAAGMLAGGQGPVEIALTTLVLNARHVVYGLAFLDRFKGWSVAKAYFAFSLTDETYALLAARPPSGREEGADFLWRVAFLNQAYWVVGCALGALVGGLVPDALAGLDFALTSLFLVLLVEQMRVAERRTAALLAGALAAAGIAALGPANTLLPVLAVALSAVALVGRRTRAW